MRIELQLGEGTEMRFGGEEWLSVEETSKQLSQILSDGLTKIIQQMEPGQYLRFHLDTVDTEDEIDTVPVEKHVPPAQTPLTIGEWMEEYTRLNTAD